MKNTPGFDHMFEGLDRKIAASKARAAAEKLNARNGFWNDAEGKLHYEPTPANGGIAQTAPVTRGERESIRDWKVPVERAGTPVMDEIMREMKELAHKASGVQGTFHLDHATNTWSYTAPGEFRLGQRVQSPKHRDWFGRVEGLSTWSTHTKYKVRWDRTPDTPGYYNAAQLEPAPDA